MGELCDEILFAETTLNPESANLMLWSFNIHNEIKMRVSITLYPWWQSCCFLGLLVCWRVNPLNQCGRLPRCLIIDMLITAALCLIYSSRYSTYTANLVCLRQSPFSYQDCFFSLWVIMDPIWPTAGGLIPVQHPENQTRGPLRSGPSGKRRSQLSGWPGPGVCADPQREVCCWCHFLKKWCPQEYSPQGLSCGNTSFQLKMWKN